MGNDFPASQSDSTQFAVLLFTDICDSTALKAQHGALEYKRAAELHNALFEKVAAEEKLTLIKNTGDGYFARTTSVAAAVRFALRFQHGMRGMAWPAFPLATRVGIHAGEVADITTLGMADVLAPAADLVARVMGLAVGGQILLTRSPFDEARHFVRKHPDLVEGLSLMWLAHGPYLFKGCEEPTEVFEVGLSCVAPLVAPPDGEKAKRALRPGDEETLGWRPADGLEIPGRPGWRLAEKLGAGGFGEVWAGERDKTRERRAFKFCFDAERLRALKREVTLTRLLRETLGERDDIVRIYDLRLDEPPYFLESELATDGNLLQWAERQGGLDAIPLATRIALVADAAAALAAAHSVGVLHKDIKPTNVLIFTGKDGQPHPRLVDFGIGTLADSSVLAQHGITAAGFTGMTLKHSSGTPTYSPPEYLAGKAFTVQGDVYSLGVMLWQLVTGRADAPLAEGWQRDVPDELLREDIALCVDGDPARRLRAADELTTRLRTLDNRRKTLTTQREAAAADQARQGRQRQTRLAFIAAFLIAAITIPLALWALREKGKAEKQTGLAKTAAAEAAAERDKARAQVKEASRSDTATAQARLAEGKWQEGVAYLGRAIRYDPENRNAQDALWRALRYDQLDAGRLPAFELSHSRAVTSAAFSPDGTRVVTASLDKTARVWDATTGQPIGAPLKHGGGVFFNDGGVFSAAFSPDGTRVVTASWDKTARVWDAVTGQPIGAPLKHNAIVRSAAFSPDGTRVVTASDDTTARVWDAVTGQPIGVPLKHDDHDEREAARLPEFERSAMRSVTSAAFNPDGTYVVTASWDKTARVWDAVTGQPIGAPLKHDHIVNSAAFSPDGTRVVTASSDKTARVWDATTGQPIGAPLKHDAVVWSAAFSPDGTRVVTASWDHSARVWDAVTGQPIGAPLKHGFHVSSAAFSPDGTRVVTASDDKTARVWDAVTGQPIGAPLKHGFHVSSAAFSPDGTRVVTASEDTTARLWDATTGRTIGAPLKHDASVNSASFSPDGTRVFTASWDKTTRVWDATTGQPIGAPLKHDESVHSAAFSPDGTYVVTASRDKTARVWDAVTGQPIGAPLKHNAIVRSAAFSPDGTRVVTASDDKTARVWDAVTGQPIGAPLKHDESVHSAAFSPDGTCVVTASEDKTARVWDATTGQPIGALLKHAARVYSAAFSPDGTRVVTASEDKTARLWDATTGRPIGAPLKHDESVHSAAFSPDGTRVVTASWDKTTRVWDATTGQPIGAPLKHDESVHSAAFSPDGTCVVTASEDKTARVWDATSGLPVTAGSAEWLTAYYCGVRLDPQFGSLRQLTNAERLALREKLTPFLATSADWAFVAALHLPRVPKTALVSPRMTMTVREATNRLISTMHPGNIREALGADPASPLLPFAHATIEAVKSDGQPANPIRAAWLVDYGMKRLPADLTAEELRIAARLIAKVAESLPEQKKLALTLLDRALSLAPEDNETKQLRESLK